MSYRGGRNIAMKVPPHRWDDTVAFYERTLNPWAITNTHLRTCRLLP